MTPERKAHTFIVLVEDLPGALADPVFEVFHGLESGLDRALIFLFGKTQHGRPGLKHLVREQLLIGQVQQGIQIPDPMFGEDVRLLGEGSLDGTGTRGGGGARVGSLQPYQRRTQDIDHRKEDHVERFAHSFHEHQVVDMRDADLGRETGVDRATAGAGAVEFVAGVVGIDDVFRRHAEAFQVSVEQRRVDIGVKHAGDADAEPLAAFDQSGALPSRFGPSP